MSYRQIYHNGQIISQLSEISLIGCETKPYQVAGVVETRGLNIVMRIQVEQTNGHSRGTDQPVMSAIDSVHAFILAIS